MAAVFKNVNVFRNGAFVRADALVSESRLILSGGGEVFSGCRIADGSHICVLPGFARAGFFV